MNEFTTKDISEGLKVSPEMIHIYYDAIPPDIEKAVGKGGTDKHSRRNYFKFRLLRELQSEDMTLEHIKPIPAR